MGETAKELTAIATVRGIVVWEMMPQGPINGPVEFQNALNHTFREMIADGSHTFYVDDGSLRSGEWEEGCVITDEDWEIRLQLWERMARIAVEAGLMSKFGKIWVSQYMVELLGYLVGEGRIQPTEERVAALLAVPKSKRNACREQVLCGLGLFEVLK